MKVKNRVFTPRLLADAFSDKNLTFSEFVVLTWIWLRADYVKGYFSTSYRTLVENLRGNIKYDAMRKVVSSLRKKRYINFANHKGVTGSFPVYVVGFYLANKQILNWEDTEKKLAITTSSQPPAFEDTDPENNLEGVNHNSEHENEPAQGKFIGKPPNTFTTPNNDNEKNKNKKSIIGKPISVSTFDPGSSDEQRCKEIAIELEEKDLRFILSALHTYNLPHLERCLGLLKEEMAKGNIKDKRKYFNSLIRTIK
jgi:hypothetical protein